MYINFQQNLIHKSVITVLTNLFAKIRKVHKFATTNSIFSKSTLSDMHHPKTYMHNNFQQNRVSSLVKTCPQIYLQKIANCINLQLAIRISKNHASWTCTTP